MPPPVYGCLKYLKNQPVQTSQCCAGLNPTSEIEFLKNKKKKRMAYRNS